MKNDFLYHGSKEVVKVLKPKQATGLGSDSDKLLALYASENRNFALLFAIPLIPDEKGSIKWSTIFKEDKFFMNLENGEIDYSKKGILYKVPKVSFMKLDEIQWASYADVEPIEMEKIDIENLVDLVILNR